MGANAAGVLADGSEKPGLPKDCQKRRAAAVPNSQDL